MHYTAALIRRLEGGSPALIRPSLDEMPSPSEVTEEATQPQASQQASSLVFTNASP